MKQFTTTSIKSFGQRSLMALGLALLALVLLVTVVAAHGLLVKSEPENGSVLEQTPEQVLAWFSEELETGSSSIQVIDTEGNQVDNGDGSVDLNDPDHTSLVAGMPESLPDGNYLVHWTAVSAEDGDQTEGEFSFSIGESGAATGQDLVTDPSAASNRTSLPLGQIIMAFGVLLLVVLGLILYRRLGQDS